MPAVSTAAAIDTVSPRNAAVLSAAKTENPVTEKKRGRPFSLKEQRKRFKIDDIRTVLGFTLCQDTGLTHHVSADAAQKLLNGGQRLDVYKRQPMNGTLPGDEEIKASLEKLYRVIVTPLAPSEAEYGRVCRVYHCELLKQAKELS